MYLAYVWSTRGPSPQKWLEMPTDGNNKPKSALMIYKLKENEELLSLDELSRVYPAPEIVD